MNKNRTEKNRTDLELGGAVELLDSNVRMTEADLVAAVKSDFEKRQQERRALELNWRLNIDFYSGNQFAQITPVGDIDTSGKQYVWQQREVFNHVAPIVETRLSKLARVRAKAHVVPATSDENDVNAAKFATAALNSICSENKLPSLITAANYWSELTGTAFYKVIWNKRKGDLVRLPHFCDAVLPNTADDINDRSGDGEAKTIEATSTYTDEKNASTHSKSHAMITAENRADIVEKGFVQKGDTDSVLALTKKLQRLKNYTHDLGGENVSDGAQASAFDGEKSSVLTILPKTADYGAVNGENAGSNPCGYTDFYTGDVDISVCSPFEIYPESTAVADICEQRSIIHAKAYSVDEVYSMYGVKVDGEDVNVFSLTIGDSLGGNRYNGYAVKRVNEKRSDSVVVIERYDAPSRDLPLGRLIIIAGDKLVHVGNLPYVNGENGSRVFPFVKQTCIDTPGQFFGTCVVERIIPIQRAYNVVKNRKHEFMNRIAAGVLAVEDGSVDVTALEEDGLEPGKVLLYRPGSTPPTMLTLGRVPTDFSSEEEKLLSEFVMISGVSEVTTYSQVPANVSSGTAISLLLGQDETRVSLTADSVRFAVLEIGKMILRLYRSNASLPRKIRIAGENGRLELRAFESSNVSSDDLEFDTENELDNSPAKQRATMIELLRLGLLTDADGKMSERSKNTALDMLGFGSLKTARDLEQLHQKKAALENERMAAFAKQAVYGDTQCDSVHAIPEDNHGIHIEEHTKLLLSENAFDDALLIEFVTAHINEHRQLEAAKNFTLK